MEEEFGNIIVDLNEEEKNKKNTLKNNDISVYQYEDDNTAQLSTLANSKNSLKNVSG